MATYNISDITIRDGKLYAGNTEVGPRDTISSATPAATPAEGTPTWLTGAPQSTPYASLPVWALNQDRFGTMLPAAPQTPEGYTTMFGGADSQYSDPFAPLRNYQLGGIGDYYSSQVDPIIEFANTGTNRDALYGAYMVGGNSVQNPTQEGGIPWMEGSAGQFSNGIFNRDAGIPDLSTQWTGEQYSPTNEWIGPVSARSATEAQQILKQFFPNVSQEDMDRAAYSALQEGNYYYNGYNQPAVNDSGSPYYGYGPLPVVTAIANKLGGVTPELAQFFDQNWKTYSDTYGQLREDAKSSASAEQQGHITDAIAGIGGILGGSFGLAGLLNGGFGSLGSLFGEGATTGATGGNMGLWDSITSGFSDFTSSLGDLFSSGASPEALGDIGGYGFTSTELGELPTLLGEAGGYNAADGGASWFNSMIEKATANPTGTAAKLVSGLMSSGGLGSLLSSGLGAYAANQQSGALEDMAKRYEGYGAPYRQRLANLYANPDSFLQSNEVQKPVQMGTDNLMRSLSMQGNPFGSGNALQQGQSYASDQLFSRLGQEKDRLAGFGGLASYNAAAPAANANAIQSQSNAWNAMGAGVNNIFNPPQTPAQQAAEWMKVMGG